MSNMPPRHNLSQEWRAKMVITSLLEVMDRQKLYWKETDFFLDHLIRFAKR